ncbi:MAG TPA: amidohydrolase [Bacteroidia bacterium]|nr:amidohydrolase [Bacteroidia bacterium]
MKVTLIQTALHWEDRQKNLAHFDTLVNSIKEPTDLIVLPEMFSTGFTMDPVKLADPLNGPSLQWMAKKAKEKNAAITGSVAVNDNGNYYNRLFWVEPNGNVNTYDKRHLFRMAGEDKHYAMGFRKIITKLKGFNICPLICYDLRFPVWSRNTFIKTNGVPTASYDVLIYVANWPEVRSYPWKQLLIARAIENQCYVIGVNRIGKDGNGFAHSGDSMVINPRGEIISKIKANEESIETVTLDKTYLDDFRKAFPVGLDADSFDIK